MVSFWTLGWGRETSAAAPEWWRVRSAARVAAGPLAISPAPLRTAVMGDTEGAVARTRDAEPKGQKSSSSGKEQEGDGGGVPGFVGTLSPSACIGANLLQTSSSEPCREVKSLFSWAKTLKR